MRQWLVPDELFNAVDGRNSPAEWQLIECKLLAFHLQPGIWNIQANQSRNNCLCHIGATQRLNSFRECCRDFPFSIFDERILKYSLYIYVWCMYCRNRCVCVYSCAAVRVWRLRSGYSQKINVSAYCLYISWHWIYYCRFMLQKDFLLVFRIFVCILNRSVCACIFFCQSLE